MKTGVHTLRMRRHRLGKALGTGSWPDVKQQTADTMCACMRVPGVWTRSSVCVDRAQEQSMGSEPWLCPWPCTCSLGCGRKWETSTQHSPQPRDDWPSAAVSPVPVCRAPVDHRTIDEVPKGHALVLSFICRAHTSTNDNKKSVQVGEGKDVPSMGNSMCKGPEERRILEG